MPKNRFLIPPQNWCQAQFPSAHLMDPSFLLLKLNLEFSLKLTTRPSVYCFLTEKTKKRLQLLKNFTSTALIQITVRSPELLHQPPK